MNSSSSGSAASGELFALASAGLERGARPVLSEISLRFCAGEFVAVCGLNGAGKSTLLGAMAGILGGYSGSCRFEGREVRAWPPRALARRVAFLPQSPVNPARFTCGEVVAMGRYPFGGLEADRGICLEAMRVAECLHLEHRYLDELSGGERQRVLFAAVLAQQPAALILDEPGTFVDLPHQVQMFRKLRDLCATGLLCVAATHDLNLALAFATRLVLLDRGVVVADGSPAQLAEGGEFNRVFGEHVRIARDEISGVVRVHYAV